MGFTRDLRITHETKEQAGKSYYLRKYHRITFAQELAFFTTSSTLAVEVAELDFKVLRGSVVNPCGKTIPFDQTVLSLLSIACLSREKKKGWPGKIKEFLCVPDVFNSTKKIILALSTTEAILSGRCYVCRRAFPPPSG